MAEHQVERSQPEDRLRDAGLNDGFIARLRELKRHVALGERSELTRAHKYLLFLKYLLDSDRLDDEVAG